MLYRANIHELEESLYDLEKSKDYFEKVSYLEFKNGYISKNNNSKIIEVKNNLNKKYTEIISDYSAIVKWLNEYIDDIKRLEKTLGTGNNTINDIETRNYVSKIIENSNITIPKAHFGDLIASIKMQEESSTRHRFEGVSRVDVEFNNKWDGENRGFERQTNSKLKEILDTYGEDVAMKYLMMTTFESERDELKTQLDEKEKELREANRELNELQKKVGESRNIDPSMYASLQKSFEEANEKVIALNKEVNDLKEKLIEKNYLFSEALHSYEISKYTWVIYDDKYKKEYEDFIKTIDLKTKTVNDNLGNSQVLALPEDWEYMTEEQLNTYLFYKYYVDKINPNSTEKADNFYNYLKDEINKAKGAKMAADWIAEYEKYGSDPNHTFSIDNVKGFVIEGGKVVDKGFWDGINNFIDGLKNVVDWNDVVTAENYRDMMIAQYIIDEGIFDDAYKVSNTFGNVLPTIIASQVVSSFASPAVGVEVASKLARIFGISLGGLSSGGNARREASLSGHDTWSSLWYGILIGASDYIVESCINKIPFFKGIESLEGVSYRELLINISKEYFKNGVEEVAQEGFATICNKICLGEDISFDELTDNMIESFCMGVLMSYVLDGGIDKTRIIIDGIKYNVDMDILANIVFDSNGNIREGISMNDIKEIILELANSKSSKTNSNTESNVVIEVAAAAKDESSLTFWQKVSKFFGLDLKKGKTNLGTDSLTKFEFDEESIRNYYLLRDTIIPDELKNNNYIKMLEENPEKAAILLSSKYGESVDLYLSYINLYKDANKIIKSRLTELSYNSIEIDLIMDFASPNEFNEVCNKKKNAELLKTIYERAINYSEEYKKINGENSYYSKLESNLLEYKKAVNREIELEKSINSSKNGETHRDSLLFLKENALLVESSENYFAFNYKGVVIEYPKYEKKKCYDVVRYLTLLDEVYEKFPNIEKFTTICFSKEIMVTPKKEKVAMCVLSEFSYVFINKCTIFYPDKMIKGYLVHELTHMVDGPDHVHSTNFEYIEAANKDNNYTSAYAENFANDHNGALSEDFAEATNFLELKGRKLFEKIYPNRAEYFKKYLKDFYYRFDE